MNTNAEINYWQDKYELRYVESFKLTPFKDGNKWCVLLGENIQEGVVGFGTNPILAILDFNEAMIKPITKTNNYENTF